MLTATQTMTCPLCEGNFPIGAERCPFCRASAAWADLQRAADFARRQFHQWTDRRVIHGEQWAKIEAHYAQARDAAIKAAARGEDIPADSGLRLADQCWDCGNVIET